MQQESGESNRSSDTQQMSRAETKLRAFLDTPAEFDALLGILRFYAYKGGLTVGAHVDDVAGEVLSEVIVEAMRSIERFDSNRSVRAWLLGIAANIVKRRKVQAKQLASELVISDLQPDADREADEQIFDRIMGLHQQDFTTSVDEADAVEQLLEPLDEDDRQVVRLAIIHEMNGVEIARVLGIKPGTARQRLYRALQRLKTFWKQEEEQGL